MNCSEKLKKSPAPVFDVFNVYFDRIYNPVMHILFEFDGRIDEKCLKDALIKTIASDPYLASCYTETDSIPYWESISPDFFEEAFHLYDISDEDDYIFRNPPQGPDVYAGPQISACVYRFKNHDSVVFSCHHGFCDAHGLKDLSAEIFFVYREIMKNPDYCPENKGWYERGTKSIIEKIPEEKIKDSLHNEEPFIDKWSFPFEYKGRGRPEYALRQLSPERLNKIKEFGKPYNATVNDIMIGAFFLALLKINSCESYDNSIKSVLTSVDIRKYYGRDKFVFPQNLSIAYEISIKAGKDSELKDIIRQVSDITARKKAGYMGLGCIAFYEEIFAGGIDKVKEFFKDMLSVYDTTGLKNPVFSNTGIIDSVSYMPVYGSERKKLEIKSALFLPVICWPTGFLMTISTFRNFVTLLSGYENGPYSREKVEMFLEYVESFLP